MKITATSQLMPNHVAGAPLSAQKSVAIAYAADHSPLLFSLDEALSFAVTLPSADSGTGWEQIDLGAQLAGLDGLTAGSKVQAFAVSQDSDGTIWLVVAAAATATAPSKVLISTGLSNGSTAADWRSMSNHLSARQIPAGLVVSHAVVGSAGGDYPLAVIVADDADGKMHHLQLNPDPGPDDWQSLPLQFATNTTRCRAVAVGVNDRYGAGVYAVCELATLVNMTFTTLPQMVSGRPVVRTVEMALPDGLNPAAISAVAAANGSTELYAAGQGVYRWPVSAQVSSNQPGLPVASAESFAGVSELLAVEDAATGHISVWGQDKRDVLMQVTGVRSTADVVTWQAALLVAPEVTAMAGYRVAAETGTSTAGLLLGTTSGAMNLTVQDPQSTFWQQQSVNLRRPEVAQTLNTYTTRVLVTDDDGRPSAGITVNIQPNTDCAVLINGAYYALKKAVAKPAVTDLNGVLTIVSETSDITAPVYTFSVSTMADGAMAAGVVTVSEDPSKQAKQTLRGVHSGPDLADARRCNGEPLFPTPPDASAAKAAATALSKVMEVHDSLAAGQRPRLAGRAASSGQPPRVLFAVHYRDGKATLLDDVDATLAVPAAEQDWQTATPGDLLRALFGESEFTYWVDDAWNFCVQIGKEFLQFLVDAAEKAIGVVDWVLRKTLGLSLDDLISWLGFIFSWGDIRRNHTAIAKMVELTLDWSVTGLIDAQAQVRGGFDTIKKMINGGGGINPDTSSPVLKDKTKTSPDQPAQAQSPEGSWGSQQLSANAQDARPTNPALPAIEDLWSTLGEEEIEVMKQAYASLQDLIENHYQEYTYIQLIEKFIEIVATAVVDAVESALITLLSAAALTATVVKALLTARWDIPVLTYVYEQIICQGDGSKLTLLDLLSLLVAIPATIGAKLVTGQNLFTDAQLNVITAATTMDQLVKGLTTAPYQLTADGEQLAADPALIAAATLEFIGMASRGVSAVFFGLRELSDFNDTLKETFNTGKIAADYLTYTMAMVSMFIVRINSPATSARKSIDAIMTAVSGIAPARDCYVISFREEHGKEMADILANGLRYVETACGLALAISACVSLGLQTNEPKPPDIDPVAWGAILAMKFLQNFCSGAYYSLAFTQMSYLPKESRYKASAVRMVILVIRWAANCTRSIMQLHYRVADYDGPL
jgi:hypothetical protein